MHPESIEDYALLARLAINGTKEVRSIHVSAYTDLTMYGAVVIGKRKQPKSLLTK